MDWTLLHRHAAEGRRGGGDFFGAACCSTQGLSRFARRCSRLGTRAVPASCHALPAPAARPVMTERPPRFHSSNDGSPPITGRRTRTLASHHIKSAAVYGIIGTPHPDPDPPLKSPPSFPPSLPHSTHSRVQRSVRSSSRPRSARAAVQRQGPAFLKSQSAALLAHRSFAFSYPLLSDAGLGLRVPAAGLFSGFTNTAGRVRRDVRAARCSVA